MSYTYKVMPLGKKDLGESLSDLSNKGWELFQIIKSWSDWCECLMRKEDKGNINTTDTVTVHTSPEGKHLDHNGEEILTTET